MWQVFYFTEKPNMKVIGIVIVLLVAVILVVVIAGVANGGNKFKLAGNVYESTDKYHRISFKLPYSNAQLKEEGYDVLTNEYNQNSGKFSWRSIYNNLEISWDCDDYYISKSDFEIMKSNPYIKYYERNSGGLFVCTIYNNYGTEKSRIEIYVNDEKNRHYFLIVADGPEFLVTPEVAQAMGKSIKVK